MPIKENVTQRQELAKFTYQTTSYYMKRFAILLLAIAAVVQAAAQPPDSLLKLRLQRAINAGSASPVSIRPSSSIITPSPAYGSIEINRNPTYAAYTPQELVEKIFIGSGSCSLVENVELTGVGWNGSSWIGDDYARTMGYFHKGTSNFPLEEGILITTAKIGYMEGPNTSAYATNEYGAPTGDSDLASLLNDPFAVVRNVAILEFDFTPVGNVVEFKYIFASQEYPNFVHSKFNDVFGFFINEVSTPGIKKNIAVLPTTNTTTNVVSINNVNNGYKLNNEDFTPGKNPSNPIYFIPNLDGSPTLEFNGHTVVLTAMALVDPCKKYHLKLAVGNITDGALDSGVFLEARSFNVGASLVNYANGAENKDNVFEGCSNMLSIRRVGDLSGSQVVTLSYTGTAVNGVDFHLPTSAMFGPGESVLNFPYTVIDDNTPNSGRYIDIAVNCPCSAVSSYTHRINVFETGTLSPLNISCNEIQASMTGGSGVYEYSIDGGTTWQAGNKFVGLTAGTYTVLGRDVGSCHSSQQTAALSAGSLTATATSGNITCYTTSDIGTITVIAANGVAPYQYSIDNGTTWQTANTFTGLTYKMYLVTVKDANGCEAHTNVNVSRPPRLRVNNVSTCVNNVNGTIEVEVEGGIPPYLYTIDDGTTWQSGSVFSGLPAGTYSNIRVKDSNGCETINYVSVITLGPPLSFTATVQPASCNGVADGAITIAPAGGTFPYLYSLDGIAWSAFPYFSMLLSGTYTVWVRDINKCIISAPVTVTSSGTLSLSLTATNTLCNGVADGSITATASGGSVPYQYSIDGGATWQAGTAFTGLAANTYTITTKDNGGCLATATQVVANGSSSLSLTIATTNATCNGTASGSIAITETGGTAPYQYSINSGTTWQPGSTFSNVAAGTYTAMVKDANGCTVSTAATVTEPAPVQITDVTYTDILCKGAGAPVAITAIGGSTPYSYSIDGGTTWHGSSPIHATAGGTYQVKVKDSNGCYASTSYWITITEPATAVSLSAAVTQSCGSATITATATGGTPPYQYSHLFPVAWSSSNTFAVSTSGTYNIMAQDANNCVAFTAPITVNLTSTFSITATSTNAVCSDNGTISAAVVGGVLPFKYSIDGGATWQTSSTFTGLAAGSYTVLVEDAISCRAASTVSVNATTVIITPIVTQSNIECNGGKNGSLILNATGGSSPYQYSIDNSQTFNTTNIYGGLQAATYTIAIKDTDGCLSAPKSVTISEPSPIDLSLSIADNTCKASINAGSTSGGAGSYQFSIDNGTSWQSSPIFSNLSGSMYTIMAKDANGCDASKTVTLRTDYLTITPDVLPIYKLNSPYHTQLQTSAIPPYAFIAENGFPQWLLLQANGDMAGTPTDNLNITHKLTVKLIDGNGCEVFKQYDLTGELFVPDIITPNGDGKNDHFMKGYRVAVYDRLGTKIFEGNDGWDGKRKGKAVVPDTYFYILFDGNAQRKGSISVIAE